METTVKFDTKKLDYVARPSAALNPLLVAGQTAHDSLYESQKAALVLIFVSILSEYCFPVSSLTIYKNQCFLTVSFPICVA
jgi:hypothetical protein